MKTSELTGAQLDWAVAKCKGVNEQAFFMYPEEFHYSTNWAKGGPIIEREKIGIERLIRACGYHGWRALKDYSFDASVPEETTWGETPLIAAMRCFVASKMGDDVELPEELK